MRITVELALLVHIVLDLCGKLGLDGFDIPNVMVGHMKVLHVVNCGAEMSPSD